MQSLTQKSLKKLIKIQQKEEVTKFFDAIEIQSCCQIHVRGLIKERKQSLKQIKILPSSLLRIATNTSKYGLYGANSYIGINAYFKYKKSFNNLKNIEQEFKKLLDLGYKVTVSVREQRISIWIKQVIIQNINFGDLRLDYNLGIRWYTFKMLQPVYPYRHQNTFEKNTYKVHPSCNSALNDSISPQHDRFSAENVEKCIKYLTQENSFLDQWKIVPRCCDCSKIISEQTGYICEKCTFTYCQEHIISVNTRKFTYPYNNMIQYKCSNCQNI